MELDNLNGGLIELLNKKYKTNIYDNNINIHKHNSITKSYLKHNINYDYDLISEIIEEYLQINSGICYYDIDILNIIIKFILKNRKLLKYIHRNKTFYDKVLDFFGNNNNTITKTYRKDWDYFNKNSLKINSNIKDIYIIISKNIILKYSN